MVTKRKSYEPEASYGLLDTNGLARLLGFSKSAIYKLSMKGELPCYRVGGKLIFKKEQIMAWLEDKKVSC